MITQPHKVQQNRTDIENHAHDITHPIFPHPDYMKVGKSSRFLSCIPFHIPTIMILFLLSTGCGTFSTLPDSYHPTNAIEPSNFSHQPFHELMQRHVEDGFVDYPGIQSDLRLETYLRQVNLLDPTSLPMKKDRLAFWINTYNAFAIKGILNGHSPKTKLGQYSYFIGEEYMVGEEEVNLWSIERDILIPRFRDPRIHFAIVCASRSCPKLRSFAFLPDRLDQQLDDSARRFINDPTRNRFDRNKKIAYLSMIFDWFAEDFVGHSGSLLNYIKQYIDNPALVHELGHEPYTIKFLDYDWDLNGTPPSQHASFDKRTEGLTAASLSNKDRFSLPSSTEIFF